MLSIEAATPFNTLRAQFLQAAKTLPNGTLQSIEVFAPPLHGLATDILRVGPKDAGTVVFLISGIHGSELAAGTFCQIDLINSGALAHLPVGLAVVLIHAINPVGAALGRRCTEENIDFCRNFVAFSNNLPIPAGYDTLRSAFDATQDQAQKADEMLAAHARKNGVPALYAAAMAGQYRDASGIGFGGVAPARARLVLEDVLLSHARTRNTSIPWIIIQASAPMPMAQSSPCNEATCWHGRRLFLAHGSSHRVTTLRLALLM